MEEAVLEKMDLKRDADEPERKSKSAANRKAADEKTALTQLIDTEVQRRFDLDEKDTKMIEHLLRNFIDGHEKVKASAVLGCIEKDMQEVILGSKRLMKLKYAGIIEILSDIDDEADLHGLISSNIRIAKGFVNSLFNEFDQDIDMPVEEKSAEIKPYLDNYEYIADQLARITLLNAVADSEVRGGGRHRNETANKTKELPELESLISSRLSKSTQSFPFEEFKKKKQLTRFEELAVLALLHCEVYPNWRNRYFDLNRLIQLIGEGPCESLKLREVFNKDGRLFKEKIVRFMGGRREENDLELDKDLLEHFISGKRHIKRRKKRDRQSATIFGVIKPDIPLEDVVLHPKTFEEVRLVIEKIHGDAGRKLHDWGFKKCGKGNENKAVKGQSATLLFYGPPGTGKTLSASAIANTLKKELLVFDCSKILSMWVGMSEKNTKMIFDEYREIVKRKKNPPVLLLNEADQFLHRRIEATRSTDHMYNQMQNIFLEQLENFEGVLIATTNLATSLDPAFSRRFDHKIEFKRPGVDERLKLWQKHIPNGTPLSEDVSLERLAQIYDFSGGQIALVVKNAAVRAAMNGDRIRMEDFLMACENEVNGNFDENIRQSVGFL